MIKIVLLDIDGVLTNGKVTMDSNGNEYKTIDFRDIDAIFQMKHQGLKVGFLTGEEAQITSAFKERFNPNFFYTGCKDKTKALKEIMSETGVTLDQICYTGDGKYDIQIMKLVKFAACPANAIIEVREIANIHLKREGGDGCIWELMEWIMDKKNHKD